MKNLFFLLFVLPLIFGCNQNQSDSQRIAEQTNRLEQITNRLVALEEKLLEREKNLDAKELAIEIKLQSLLKPEKNLVSAQILDTESSGEEKYYDLTGLITNMGGPVKSRYINIELKLEGLAGDFEKLIEINEHRIRDRALTILGQYTYEDAQLDGFQERVREDLKKGFSIALKKYQDGQSELIRNIYFTQFVVQ